MRDKPFFYAGAAVIYISLVASFLYYVPKSVGSVDSVVIPIAMLSLFVLSAAVMGFLFLYRPLTFYLDGQRREAVKFFGATLLIFACITIFIFAVMFLPFVYSDL